MTLSSNRIRSPAPYASGRTSLSGHSFAGSVRGVAEEVRSIATETEQVEGDSYPPFDDFEPGPIAYCDNDDSTLHYSLQANLEAIQEGFKVQQSCMSEIFLCHDQKSFESLLTWLKQDNTTPPTSSVLCELCAVAVVAGRYVQDSFEPGLLGRWYGESSLN
jgi:hypothetical protein